MKQRTRNRLPGLVLIPFFTLLVGCGSETQPQEPPYLNITQEEAKELMDSESNYIILDVRTQEEYDSGHIPGAILIPDYEIEAMAESILTDKNQLILVYCRSGRRSKLASQQLETLGYTKIREFGGIIDWQYDIVTPQTTDTENGSQE